MHTAFFFYFTQGSLCMCTHHSGYAIDSEQATSNLAMVCSNRWQGEYSPYLHTLQELDHKVYVCGITYFIKANGVLQPPALCRLNLNHLIHNCLSLLKAGEASKETTVTCAMIFIFEHIRTQLCSLCKHTHMLFLFIRKKQKEQKSSNEVNDFFINSCSLFLKTTMSSHTISSCRNLTGTWIMRSHRPGVKPQWRTEKKIKNFS